MNEAFRPYGGHVTSEAKLREYHMYQDRYVENPKECDKRTAQLVMAELHKVRPLIRPPHILDIGCSTGNFLRYLRRLMPHAQLTGGDISTITIDRCRKDPTLAGISFDFLDVLNLPKRIYDIITINAVLLFMSPSEHYKAMQSIANALVSSGSFISYEWIFPGDKQQEIHEPGEVRFWIRSEEFVIDACRYAGLTADVFPFDIPIDLPKPADGGLGTYTKRDPITGRRLMYRGDAFQPWAHMIATKRT